MVFLGLVFFHDSHNISCLKPKMLFYVPSLQATKNHCPLIWPATIGPYFLRGGDGIGGAIILLTSKTKKSNQHTGKHTTKPKNYQHITTSQTQNKPFRQFSAIAAFKPCPSFWRFVQRQPEKKKTRSARLLSRRPGRFMRTSRTTFTISAARLRFHPQWKVWMEMAAVWIVWWVDHVWVKYHCFFMSDRG